MGATVPELIAEGRQAIAANDWSAAYELLRRAADELDGFGADDYEDLARSAWWTGHPDECIDAREQAFAAYVRDGKVKRAAMAAMDLAEGNFHKKAAAVGHGWVKQAERLLHGVPDSVEHGWLARIQGVIAFEGEDDLEGGLALAKQAYEAATRFGDLNLQALTLHDRGRILVASGAVEEGMSLMDEAMVAAVSGGLSPLYTGKIYCNMIDICEQLADYRRAGDWSDAAKRWCERAGHSSGFPGVCRVHRAEILRLRGDWSAAAAEAERASTELGNFVDFAGEAFYEIGEIRLHMGDLDTAEDAFRQAHALGRDPQPGLAEFELARRDSRAAWALISRSLEQTAAPLKRARLLPTAIDAALADGQGEVAEELANELQGIAEEYGSPALRAHAATATGALHASRNELEEAAADLSRAVKMWQTNDFPYLAARARLKLGLVYRDQGADQLADMEIEAARKTFADLGAARDVREARRQQTAGPGTGSARHSLVALMFTDIVNSTALIGVIGDQAWESLLDWHNRTLRSVFAANDGDEIENTGDGFFVTFVDPASAVECAREIQARLNEHRREQGFAPFVRIGLHYGKAAEVSSSLAGQEVHKAARITAQAGPGEIIASVELAAGAGLEDAESYDVTLKGFPKPARVIKIQ